MEDMGGLKEKEEKEGWRAEEGLCLQQQRKEIWALAFQNQVWMKGASGVRAALDAECLWNLRPQGGWTWVCIHHELLKGWHMARPPYILWHLYMNGHPYLEASYLLCKTQNSGLRSKEEKPCDPINQPSRCNTQEGLLSAAQTGWLWSPGRQSTPNSKLGKLFIDKNHSISILHTGYKVIGYMFAKQSYWHKLRGLLFKLKAILLVQTARAFVQT